MSASRLHATYLDSVIIRDLRCHATIGHDRWGNLQPQPVRVTIHLETSLARAGHSDNMMEGVNYTDLFREFMALVNGGSFDNLRGLAEAVVMHTLAKPGARAVKVEAEALNQFLLADALVVTLYRDNEQVAGATTRPLQDKCCIRDLRTDVIIGASPAERELCQPVITNITFEDPGWIRPNWHEMYSAILKAIRESSYHTIEAFATNVARVACHLPGASVVTVRAYKPATLAFAGSSGVEITRDRAFFINMDLSILHSLQIDNSYAAPPPPSLLAAATAARASMASHGQPTHSRNSSGMNTANSSPVTSPASPTPSLQPPIATTDSTSPLLARRATAQLHATVASSFMSHPIMVNHI